MSTGPARTWAVFSAPRHLRLLRQPRPLNPTGNERAGPAKKPEARLRQEGALAGRAQGTRPSLGLRTFTTAKKKRAHTEKRSVRGPRWSGQATKGARWMPRHQGPKKGVARLRKASVSCQASSPEDTRMGQPGAGHTASRRAEHIGPIEGTGGTETS